MKRARASKSLTKSSAARFPKEYIPAVIDGIEEAIKGGVYAGYQVIDIKVEVVDGSFHEVDSNELAFKMAGIFALERRLQKGRPDFARTD